MSNTYYVSVTGCDKNDGLSPERPVQSFDRMAELAQPGDCVLFKRGDVFRLRAFFTCPDAVTYDAYGEGDKPRIYGSLCNYAQADLWEQTQENDLWKCTIDYDGDVCHIVFDEGAAWSVRRQALAEVTEELDYFYDYDLKAVFMRCSGHPAERFSSIEMGITNLICLPNHAHDITFRNLDLRHCNYAFFNNCGRLHDLHDVRFEYCDFSWIGGHEGHYAPGGVRDGNAIALWGNARRVVVDHCNFFQIYDTAVTLQCRAKTNSDVIFEDFTMTNCRLEKCQYSTEFWIHVQDEEGNQIGVMRNFLIENNHFIGAGEGFSACQRWNAGPLLASTHVQTMSHEVCGCVENFVMRNNIFERAAYDLMSFYWYKTLPIMEGNTYIQVKGRPFAHMLREAYQFDDAAEETIRQFDKTATVRFVEE